MVDRNSRCEMDQAPMQSIEGDRRKARKESKETRRFDCGKAGSIAEVRKTSRFCWRGEGDVEGLRER